MFDNKLKLCATLALHPDQPSRPTEEYVAISHHGPSEWSMLLAQLKAPEDTGKEKLYGLLSRGIRYYSSFQLAPKELENKIHDMIAIVVEAIRQGELRDSELLARFIHNLVHQQLEEYIAHSIQKNRMPADIGRGMAVAPAKENLEQVAQIKQNVRLMTKVLRCLSQSDLDILERFYVQEQRYEHFCGELCVTETQFRLLKSRVKVKLEELTRKPTHRHA